MDSSKQIDSPTAEPQTSGSVKGQRWLRSRRQTTDSHDRGHPSRPYTGKAPPETPSGADAETNRKRFIEPYRFGGEQREAIDQALARAGLDDAISRDIFIGAIAYELAVLQSAQSAQAAEAPPREPPAPVQSDRTAVEAHRQTAAEPSEQRPAPSAEMLELGTAAAALAQRIDGLAAASREQLVSGLQAADPFARDHGERYLQAMATELARLAAAVGELSSPGDRPRDAPPNTPEATPPKQDKAPEPEAAKQRDERNRQPTSLDAATLTFIREAARVFAECFDLAPTTRAAGPFAQALAAITKTTGIAIPTRVKDLKQALSRD